MLVGEMSGSDITAIALELQISCEGVHNLSGQLPCRHQSLEVRMWYNLEPVTVPPCTRRSQKRPFSIPIAPSDAHPILRIEASKSNSSDLFAKQTVNLELPSEPAAIDACMELHTHHGQCLAELTGSLDMPLRTNHTLQFDCLVNEDDTINQCAEWRGCLNGSDGLDTLLTVLEAFSMTPDATDETTISHSGQEHALTSNCTCIDDPNHQTCIDPETLDLEAFDCNCFNDLVNMSATELNEETCGRADICCDWKTSHCATTCTWVTSTLLEARRTLVHASVLTKHMETPLDEPSSLVEKTLLSKCTSD
jgi:hypothetical protein